MSIQVNERSEPAPTTSETPLIRIRGLRKLFPITRGILFQKRIGNVHAVDGVDLEIFKGETLGLVGETGCGKSTLARVVMRLYEATEGSIEFEGQDITRVHGKQLRGLRREMQMIFQDPFASLNPRKTVGSIIGTPFRLHGTVPRNKIKGEVQQLMELVGLNPEHYNRYPHEFSGGQRQRIGVARSLALRPKLIVCDEPVSALDVSIQAQVLNLLEDLQEEFNLTYLFIAHDLSVVKHVSDRVAVMYLGKIVEMAEGQTLYNNPKHPYSGALLSAVPIPDPDLAAAKKRIILEGDVPSPIDPPSGCRFHPRCPNAQFPKCSDDEPVLVAQHEGQVAACHFPLADRAIIQADPGESR
ncbi:MAG TPA: oligopeptide/dipeptide ABC transporter ATP-binding protein [Actinomycetota bacterium]|nr:oligopeptide/dipeptide ABC transporter ATP-binding protein [Actinomycetota bacterium]